MAFEEGHGEEGLPVSLVDLVDRANVLVIQARGCLGFSDETGFVFGVFDGVGGQELQRDGTFELGVLGLVDHPHAAPADLGEDLVVGDGFADHDGSILP